MEAENSGQTGDGRLKRLLGLAELPPFGQHVLAGGELSLVNPSPQPDVLGLQEQLDTISWQN